MSFLFSFNRDDEGKMSSKVRQNDTQKIDRRFECEPLREPIS